MVQFIKSQLFDVLIDTKSYRKGAYSQLGL